jgi:hypothetical protein
MVKTNKIVNNFNLKNQYYSQPSIQYEWIDKLLETPIEDGRKYCLWKILCPYLVNIKKIGCDKSFEILKIWLEKCNNSRKLDFDPGKEIRDKLSCVKHYNPISIKTFRNDNNNLYLKLRAKIITSTYY